MKSLLSQFLEKLDEVELKLCLCNGPILAVFLGNFSDEIGVNDSSLKSNMRCRKKLCTFLKFRLNYFFILMTKLSFAFK